MTRGRSLTPRPFAATTARARTVVDAEPLATVVTADLDSAELPLLCVDSPGATPTTMIGHASAAGPFGQLVGAPPVDALAVHRGEQGYVSPSWYPSKASHGRVVPTWDYVVVRLRGTLTASDDDAEIERAIEMLTTRMEATRAVPWSTADAPAAYIAQQRRAVVALRLQVEHVDATDKLSQNRPAADVDGVVAGLIADGNDALASAVHRTR